MGMAGNGRPLQSCMSITLVRSSPVTVTVPDSPCPPGCTWTLVITPSNSGCGVPFRVTISMTRRAGITGLAFCAPAMMKMVFSSDFD